MVTKTSEFRWTFRRLGGLDQVVFQGGDDLCRLRALDPKLWVALSCPATGLQFDARTLAFVDSDKDGRIRIPEVADAAEWACARLKNPAALKDGADSLPLDAIDDAGEDGRRLALTGRAILDTLGKTGADGLTQEDVTRAVAHASEQTFNGDGVLPPLPDFEPDVQAFIRDALAVVGGVADAGGGSGVNQAIADAFVKALEDWTEWRRSVDQASAALGDDASAAWELLGELRDRVDDYFLRCELAAYAPGVAERLDVNEKRIVVGESGLLETGSLAELPLARVGPDRPLDLRSGLNPAWRERVECFAGLVRPLLASPEAMTRDDWTALQKHFEPYAKALEAKPAVPAAAVETKPTATPDTLGEARVREILTSGVAERFARLAAKDADVPAAAADIVQVERLVLYHRHLYRLLVNFVNFEEFYAQRRSAAFQSGRLYIDGRCCRLCMPAAAVEEHAALAANSQFFLLYCACERKDGADGGETRKISVVAAVTSGDSDLLTVGRNGVYIDNNGLDWDAAVVKVVANPIGVWQALWSPYKRFGAMVAEQIGKLASAKQEAIAADAGRKLGDLAAAAPKAGASAPGSAAAPGTPAGFDIGRSAGIFAAVGLALGALGTAVGSIAGAVFGMSWWQFPLLLGGLFAVISGPSVVLAWLKLRKRTLGPLLEASGWAVNGRVTVDNSLARALTSTAALPPGAGRTRDDPVFRARRRRRAVFWAAVLAGALAVVGWQWWRAHSAADGTVPAPSEQVAGDGAVPDAEEPDAASPQPPADGAPEADAVPPPAEPPVPADGTAGSA